ncbi:MAG TPA: hypothetical protein VE684_22185 [Crenalkalicoccus sp.]|jgi:hypothetical protein|nr:hypothetical protein [Crenalkalicoccus sp.]
MSRTTLSALLAAGALTLAAQPAPATAGEIMTDRCSASVAFVPAYGEQPDHPGTKVVNRPTNGSTAWSEPFTVRTDGDGHIRWWCHSTTGNWADLATYGFDASGIPICLGAVVGTVVSEGSSAASLAGCAKLFTVGASAWHGWTPEQSRCSDHSTRIRVRLGPDRLLQTECLGH